MNKVASENAAELGPSMGILFSLGAYKAFYGMPIASVLQMLRSRLPRSVMIWDATSKSSKHLSRLLKDADVLIYPAFPWKIPSVEILSANNLKFVQLLGVGTEEVPLAVFEEKGIPVATIGKANAIAVAEHTLALMFALEKKLCVRRKPVRKGFWRKALSGELHDSTIGIIGLGSIGWRVAEIAVALGMRVIYWSRTRKYDKESQLRIEYMPVTEEDRNKGLRVPEKLLKDSDVISVHLALAEETRGIIGEEELKRVKKSCYIINTARGGIIDEGTLYKALKEERIAGAGIDTWWAYPPTPHAPSEFGIHKLPDVIATPHSAAYTAATGRRAVDIIVKNIERVLQGKAPLNLIAK